MHVKPADIVTIVKGTTVLKVKVEDGSKSESISGKVEHVEGDDTTYKIGNVYTFARDELQD